MRQLTMKEKTFIDSNYTTRKPREMAASLEISNELVRGYMNDMEYKSICRVTPPKPFTEQEKQYIRENVSTMTVNQMAVNLNRRFGMVKKFIEQQKLPLNLKSCGRQGSIIRIYKPVVKEPLVRPEAVYSNPNWQTD